MSDIPVEIIKTLSVTLTRDKQDIIDNEFDVYAKAVNHTIKTIFKKHITSSKAVFGVLYEEMRDMFVFGDSKVPFGNRFSYALVSRFVNTKDMKPEDARQEFAEKFAHQFISDVIKTASVEISRYRKLAKMVVSMRDKVPYFKPGIIIVSGPLIKIDEKAASLLTLNGQELSIPFDKRSRNREANILEQIAGGKRKIQRVRFGRNREGYLNIDIRLPRN